jgi:curved DNA-binding protein CbpA
MKAQKETPLSGDLKEVPFPEVLHTLYIRKQTGVLALENDRINKEVYFREGYPIFVKSNILNETLGRLLLKQGKISQEVYEKSLKKMVATREKQGSILLEMGYLTPQELYDAIQFQVKYRIFDCFGWAQGKYQFSARDDFFEDITTFDFNPAWIIYQGIQQKFSQERLQGIMKNYLDQYPVKNTEPPYRFEDMGIGPRELQLISLINGSRTLRDIIAISKMGIKQTVQLLYALISAQMITLYSRAETVKGEKKISITQQEKKSPKKELSTENKKLRDSLIKHYLELKEKNYFEILGIKQDASKEEIKKVYFQLAKKYHPDKYFEDTESEIKKTTEDIFRIISRAYDILIHDKERRKYEEFLRTGKSEEEASREVNNIVNAEIQFQKGEVFLKKKNYDGALEAFNQAIELNPKEGEYYVYLGWTLFRKSHPGQESGIKKAEEYIRKGISINPRISDAYVFLGNISKLKGSEAEAENQFKKALEYNPNCTEALREIRLINMRKEKEKGVFKKLFK